ncbi:MAG: hypothetical protein Q7O66_04515 [Dehalococcoidia bacterium]|nr:hypothetical protein [Dehalococcoidia bacterium]
MTLRETALQAQAAAWNAHQAHELAIRQLSYGQGSAAIVRAAALAAHLADAAARRAWEQCIVTAR